MCWATSRVPSSPTVAVPGIRPPPPNHRRGLPKCRAPRACCPRNDPPPRCPWQRQRALGGVQASRSQRHAPAPLTGEHRALCHRQGRPLASSDVGCCLGLASPHALHPHTHIHTLLRSYFLSRHCAVCDSLTHATKPLCERCMEQPQLAAAVLSARWSRLERQYAQLVRLCLHCGGGGARSRPHEGARAGAGAVSTCPAAAPRALPSAQRAWLPVTGSLTRPNAPRRPPPPSSTQAASPATRWTAACTLSGANCGRSWAR
jgi:hypothetical protein